jgi:putative transposase
VTHNRIPILVDHVDLLRDAMNRYIGDKMIAWVILPDHCHFLMNLGDENMPTLMKRVKLSFSTSYRKRVGMREGQVWQYRYWDRIIRNERDMQSCFDYIHFNPVKHRLVESPFEWAHSSAQGFQRSGYYEDDWVCGQADVLNMKAGE